MNSDAGVLSARREDIRKNEREATGWSLMLLNRQCKAYTNSVARAAKEDGTEDAHGVDVFDPPLEEDIRLIASLIGQ